MSEALKPCDFCGFADFGTQHFQVDDSNRWGWVICGECEARGPSVRVAAAAARPVPWQDDARDTWNRRTPSPAVRALVRAAEDMLASDAYRGELWRALEAIKKETNNE